MGAEVDGVTDRAGRHRVSLPTAALGEIKPPLVAVPVLVFPLLGLPVSGGPAGRASFDPSLLVSLRIDDVVARIAPTIQRYLTQAATR